MHEQLSVDNEMQSRSFIAFNNQRIGNISRTLQAMLKHTTFDILDDLQRKMKKTNWGQKVRIN